MHAYRSHNCVELTETNVGQQVKLSGWINRKRDHGQLVFVDLRDHYGLTQCVADSSDASFEMSASNSIKPMQMFYNHNVATHRFGLVLVNTTIANNGKNLPWKNAT